MLQQLKLRWRWSPCLALTAEEKAVPNCRPAPAQSTSPILLGHSSRCSAALAARPGSTLGEQAALGCQCRK